MKLRFSPAVFLPAVFKKIQLLFFSSLVVFLTFSLLEAGPRHSAFRGKVVFAGPEAISVRSERDIYLVRSFRYTPGLAKKIRKNRPAPGRRVKVHFYQGTDLAFKVN